jgi:hypothetical protein
MVVFGSWAMIESIGDETETGKIQGRFRQIAMKNLDAIGQGLVQRAGEGNYNAANLLLQLGGIGPSQGKGDRPGGLPRMFLLDLVDKLLGRGPGAQALSGADDLLQCL